MKRREDDACTDFKQKCYFTYCTPLRPPYSHSQRRFWWADPDFDGIILLHGLLMSGQHCRKLFNHFNSTEMRTLSNKINAKMQSSESKWSSEVLPELTMWFTAAWNDAKTTAIDHKTGKYNTFGPNFHPHSCFSCLFAYFSYSGLVVGKNQIKTFLIGIYPPSKYSTISSSVEKKNIFNI